MRVAIFGVGAAATTMAIQVASVYELFVLCSDFVYVMLFPQLTCVIYFIDMNTYGSLLGFIIGLFFRLAGGDPSLGLNPLIKYPWYNKQESLQLFPFKTFAMLTTFVFIFIGSYFTKFIFEREVLSKNFDIFKCIVNKSDRQTEIMFKPNKDLYVICSNKDQYISKEFLGKSNEGFVTKL